MRTRERSSSATNDASSVRGIRVTGEAIPIPDKSCVSMAYSPSVISSACANSSTNFTSDTLGRVFLYPQLDGMVELLNARAVPNVREHALKTLELLSSTDCFTRGSLLSEYSLVLYVRTGRANATLSLGLGSPTYA